MTDTTATDTAVKAVRGDIAVVETVHRTSYVGRTAQESVSYAVVLVTSVTRDGQVKAVKDTRWGDTVRQVKHMTGVRSISVVSKKEIDVEEALAHVAAHTYPGGTTPVDYASVAEVRSALRPFRVVRGTRITTAVEKREIASGLVIDITWFDVRCSCGYKPGVGYTDRASAEKLCTIHARDCAQCV